MALMVGVSGVRGIVGETLTPEVALQFAHAYGTLLEGRRVVLARDSRPSGEMFAAAVVSGLLAAGCPVTDLGIAMTPTVGHAIRTEKYAGGVVITASHNPGQWNGLKFLDELGLAPDPDRARRIAEIRAEGHYRNVRADFPARNADAEAGERHAEAVLAAMEVDPSPLRGMRVVLDSVNGAGCQDTPGFLSELGCEVVHINGEPTGVFAHPPEPLAENLTQLCQAVRQAHAAVGFAQDPDADRLAIVDEEGEFIGEEYTLALSAESVLSRRAGPVAANLSTSRMIDDVAARHGVTVVRTPVGEAHVARAMLANDCVIGGEGNGGVIDLRISPVRDSLTGISQVLQLVAATGQTIGQLVASLPRYALIKQKLECPRERIDRAVEAVSAAFAGQRLNRSDGVRIDLADGWVHLRASNTEPIMRVMAEAGSDEAARALVGRVRAAAGL
ncbi:MAG: phosphoglucosamine mutase [Planctomycetes bacterium]|nr:phosphoglucosamine mutase [Planctomycetota bacterium]